jgi:hypothetical protein
MLDWQYPSLTEKQALFNHSFYHDEPDPGNVYFGFPWATLLDLLCPEGSGPNTIRLWESIAVGSIPVVFSDNWKPPTVLGADRTQFSVWIPNAEYDQTIRILESIDESARRTMRNNCLSIYKKFSSMRCF